VGYAAMDGIITALGPGVDVPDNILFNGTNANSKGGGQRLNIPFQPGKRHLMRFINQGVDNFYKVGLDEHMFQVVAIDFVPVVPYYTQWVSIGVGESFRDFIAQLEANHKAKGQRFDAIVTANATLGNYWLRAVPQSCIANKNDGKGDLNAIISYEGASSDLPTSTMAPYIDGCRDEPLESTVPFIPKPVTGDFKPRHLPVASPYKVTSSQDGRVFRWIIGNTTQIVDWQNPLLLRLLEGNDTIGSTDNIVSVDEANQWTYWYIQNNFYEPHP